MKKTQIILLVVVFIFFEFAIQAQSPRVQLLEYFDNTSIPSFGYTCNANMDSLIANYSNEIACINYHVSWGDQTGTDPMNLENPIPPEDRRNFYGVNYDPIGFQDGGVTKDSTYNGEPSLFNSSFIRRRNLVSSPFSISVSHHLNAAQDTIFTRTVITKTDTLSVPGLDAIVVVLEKVIHFGTPPGIEGDTNYYNVMKQMLPKPSGIALSIANVGDSTVYNFNWKLANVYDVNQLCVVSFVQYGDSSYREVFQAGQDFPIVTGIPSINSIKLFDLFPNPASGMVYMNIQSNSYNDLRVYITDMLGETIYAKDYGKTLAGIYSMDLSRFSSGFYFVKVEIDGQSQIKKLIIAK
jgi:Secretion system C-terminal sorting domain